MDVRFTLSGAYKFPEGSTFVEGAKNQIQLPDGKGIVSVQPVIEHVTGTDADDHRDLVSSEVEALGIIPLDYDRTTENISQEVANGQLTLFNLKIDTEFVFRGMEVRNRITDIGTRTATYITLDQEDPRNYNGPPFSIVENVLDEYDLAAIDLVPQESDNSNPDTSNDVVPLNQQWFVQ
jgi:hypothetical protein